MANEVTYTNQKQAITITGLDANLAGDNDDLNGLLTNDVLSIYRIVFYPSAVGDQLIMRDGALDGSPFFDSGVIAGYVSPISIPFPMDDPLDVNPYIKLSECTFDTASDCKIMIYIKKPRR